MYMVQIYIYDTFPLLGAGNAGARAGAASAGRLLSRGHCAGGAPLELLSAFYVKMIICQDRLGTNIGKALKNRAATLQVTALAPSIAVNTYFDRPETEAVN